MDDAAYVPAAEMPRLFPGTTEQYWRSLRHRGTGPPYLKLARKVFYSRTSLELWAQANTYTRPDRPVATTGGDV